MAGAARPAVDDANPRADNLWGHILRWNEAGGDATATTFAWDIFLLAGNPKTVTDRTQPALRVLEHHGGQHVQQPGRAAFDSSGRLWIQTDGSSANTGDFDGQGNNQMLVADVGNKRGRAASSSGPPGARSRA